MDFFLHVKPWELISKTGIPNTWIRDRFFPFFLMQGVFIQIQPVVRGSVILETCWKSFKFALSIKKRYTHVFVCVEINLFDNPNVCDDSSLVLSSKCLGKLLLCIQRLLSGATVITSESSYYQGWKRWINYSSAGSFSIQSEVFVYVCVTETTFSSYRQDSGYKPAFKFLWGKAVCWFTVCQPLGAWTCLDHMAKPPNCSATYEGSNVCRWTWLKHLGPTTSTGTSCLDSGLSDLEVWQSYWGYFSGFWYQNRTQYSAVLSLVALILELI